MIKIANRIGSGDFPVSKPHPCKTQGSFAQVAISLHSIQSYLSQS
jgi:hypothetical protein